MRNKIITLYQTCFIKTPPYILLFVTMVLGANFLYAQKPVIVSSEKRIEILPAAGYLTDQSGALTINEIKSGTSFKPLESKLLQLGFTNDIIWVKFALQNNDSNAESRLLEINNKELDSITLYAIDANRQLYTYHTGDFVSDKSGSFFPAFTVNVPGQSTIQYFLRIKSSSAIHFNVSLWQEVSYMKYLNIHDKMLWLFIGILFIRLIYVLVLSRFIKDRPFTIYAFVIFVLFAGVLANAVNLKGMMPGTQAANYLLNCFYIIIPVGLSAWVYSLLKKYNNPRKIKYAFGAIYGLGFAALASGIFWLQQSNYVFACNLYLQITLLFLMGVCFSLLRRQKQVPIIYLLPGMFLIFNQFHYSLINLNIYPFSQVVLIILSGLFSTEVITMSLLLGGILKKSYRTNLETIQHLQNVRNKISADLHDELGSVLTQISLQSDMIKSGIYTEEQKEKELQSISNTSRQALHAMSDIVWSVKTGNDKIANLIDRMRDHADIMLQSLNITARFSISGLDEDRAIHNHIKQELFFIYKEAIHNIVKHTSATEVNVRLNNDDRAFEMTIDNDINEQKPNGIPGGNGLINMRQRAAGIDAELRTGAAGNIFTVYLKREAL